MEIEQVRKDMIRRFTDLEPDLSPDVLDDFHYESIYRTPFRARNARALTKYEEKHSIQFCMSCRDYDKVIDKIIVYRAYITEDDNLLENKRNSWIRMQCFHCDFDLRFDKPAPKQKSVTEEQVRMIQELMTQQGMSAQQMHETLAAKQQAGLAGGFGHGMAGMSAGEVQMRQAQYSHEVRRMVDSAQFVVHPPISGPFRQKYDAKDFGAVSAPPPEKPKSRFDRYRKLKKGEALS